MTRNQFYRAVFVLMTALGCLFIAILFALITKDDWHLFGALELIATIVFFLTIPAMCWLSNYYGIMQERNRQRDRINNFMATYQLEPHGIRFSQKHRREG